MRDLVIRPWHVYIFHNKKMGMTVEIRRQTGMPNTSKREKYFGAQLERYIDDPDWKAVD